MAKILVVTKPDKTVHRMPLANKAGIMQYNNRVKLADRWNIQEMDEEEANALPFVNVDFVADEGAAAKIKAKENELAEKDAQLKALEAKLAELEKATATDAEKAAAKEAAKAEKAAAKEAALGK